LELWVKVGHLDPKTSRTSEEENVASPPLKVTGNVDLVCRYDRVAKTTPDSGQLSLTNAGIIELQKQWSLYVKPDGSVVFSSLPSVQDSLQHSVLSPPNTLRFGEWCHVAIIVDSSSSAKEVSTRLKSVSKMLSSSMDMPSVNAFLNAPLPLTSVKLLVGGEVVGEGSVCSGAPLPILDAPPVESSDIPTVLIPPVDVSKAASDTFDALVLGPNIVGRIAEVRLWAKKRTTEEISDSKDFHLDLAESKRTKILINIKAAASDSKLEPQKLAVPTSKSLISKPGALSAPVSTTSRRLKAPVALSEVASSSSEVVNPSNDEFDAFGASNSNIVADGGAKVVEKSSGDDDFESTKPKSSLKLGGGLGAPPPANLGGKKAALMKARLAAAKDEKS
jgi:hypothetical protein